LNKQEFKECFDLYFSAIRKYVYYRSGDSELASDIAQDVFLKLWEKHLPYEVQGVKNLLYKMASDSFVSHLRKKAVHNKHEDGIKLRFELNNDAKSALMEERKKSYTQALQYLKEPNRSTFLMNKMEGLTHREIASRLGLSVKAVEKRVAKSVMLLKKHLNILK